MTCQDYELFIQKKLDGLLSPEEASRLEAHLAQCPDCARLSAEYSRLELLLQQNIARVEAPTDLCAAVMAALPDQPQTLQQKKASIKKQRPLWRWAAYGLAAAAVFAGFFFSGLLTEQPNAEQPSDLPILAELEDPEQPTAMRRTQSQPEQSQPEQSQPEQSQPEQSQPEQSAPQPPQGESEVPLNVEADPQPVTAEADPAQQPVTAKQPEDLPTVEELPEDSSHKNEFSLPPVAHGNSIQGDYNLKILAAVEGYDARNPLVKGSTVSFYVETEEAYLEYQVDLGGADAVFLGESESLPSAQATAGCMSLEGFDFSCVEAVSADGLIAQNRGGEAAGLWLLSEEEESLLSELGGGSLLSWSADGNKLLYTDSENSLHIYYVAENILLDLCDSPVHSFCWGSDGKSIVFSALDTESGYYSIFTVIVP